MLMMHNLTINYNVQRPDYVNQAMICQTKDSKHVKFKKLSEH